MTEARSSGGGGRFHVDVAAAGIRLDTFVGRSLGISVTGGRRLIAAGAVLVDGHAAPKGARVSVGAVVDVAPAGDPAMHVLPDRSLVITVLYEDEDLVAIDKPAGMPSHPLEPNELGTAANALVSRYPECAAASADPREGGLGHRLDTATSGVLIAARSRRAWQALRRALAADDCEKRYLCEVWGTPPGAGLTIAEIAGRGRRGRTVRTNGDGRSPRPARTEWMVIASRGKTALVEARLHAGRRHQVRAHLAASGFPIVGDDRYGGAGLPTGDAAGSGGAEPHPLHLHAASVRFVHPATRAEVFIEAPAPLWAVMSLPAL